MKASNSRIVQPPFSLTSAALITLLGFFAAGALALPTAQQETTETTDATTEGPATPNAKNVQVDYGKPRCPDPRLDALCMAKNANAYCDAQGFHNDFMKTCKACTCEP
ncbi:hypothetical protein B0T20DRAFT_478108 [Sordaria brevicollis]|uniref:ShKT domain-containing protein n=1 Tax=Sordaria brevicollis TaxID=83679 RepID=A0AAE0PI82_SORBR|nr:hypothetical protein B0T20DRAFT_478108 [Sordaria brevicollis]